MSAGLGCQLEPTLIWSPNNGDVNFELYLTVRQAGLWNWLMFWIRSIFFLKVYVSSHPRRESFQYFGCFIWIVATYPNYLFNWVQFCSIFRYNFLIVFLTDSLISDRSVSLLQIFRFFNWIHIRRLNYDCKEFFLFLLRYFFQLCVCSG